MTPLTSQPASTYKTGVVIAGGGLAGIVTAYELLNRGHHVLQERQPTDLRLVPCGSHHVINSQHLSIVAYRQPHLTIVVLDAPQGSNADG